MKIGEIESRVAPILDSQPALRSVAVADWSLVMGLQSGPAARSQKIWTLELAHPAEIICVTPPHDMLDLSKIAAEGGLWDLPPPWAEPSS